MKVSISVVARGDGYIYSDWVEKEFEIAADNPDLLMTVASNLDIAQLVKDAVLEYVSMEEQPDELADHVESP